jgi:hypothetical protein
MPIWSDSLFREPDWMQQRGHERCNAIAEQL